MLFRLCQIFDDEIEILAFRPFSLPDAGTFPDHLLLVSPEMIPEGELTALYGPDGID